MNIEIEYDRGAKAIYIKLRNIPDGGVDHTEELVPDTVMIDKTKSGEIVGIEVVGIENLEDITENLPWPENAAIYQLSRDIKRWWRNRSKWWANRPRLKKR